MGFIAPVFAAIGGGSVATGAAVTATAIGTGVSVYSGIKQAKAAEQAADYNAAVARNNAILVEQQHRQESLIAANQAQWLEYNQRVQENRAAAKRIEGETLRTTTEENLRRRRDDYRRILARQRAQFAKSGVALAGTPIEVLAESAARMELEAQEIGRQARAGIEALYYEAELAQAGSQAVGADVYMMQWQARNALQTGRYRADLLRTGATMDQVAASNRSSGAGASLLAGASQIAGYYR